MLTYGGGSAVQHQDHSRGKSRVMAFVSLPTAGCGTRHSIGGGAGRWWNYSDRRGRYPLSASIATRPQIERASAAHPGRGGGGQPQDGLARHRARDAGTAGTGVARATRRVGSGNSGPPKGRVRGTDNPHSRRFVQKVCMCVARRTLHMIHSDIDSGYEGGTWGGG